MASCIASTYCLRRAEEVWVGGCAKTPPHRTQWPTDDACGSHGTFDCSNKDGRDATLHNERGFAPRLSRGSAAYAGVRPEGFDAHLKKKRVLTVDFRISGRFIFERAFLIDLEIEIAGGALVNRFQRFFVGIWCLLHRCVCIMCNFQTSPLHHATGKNEIKSSLRVDKAGYIFV
jgi:hypothetical protein